MEPDDAFPVVVDKLQQGRVGFGAESDCLFVVSVAALEHNDDDVVFVDNVCPEAPRVFNDADAEPACVLKNGSEPVVVGAEAAELVVVLAGHMPAEDECVYHVRHVV